MNKIVFVTLFLSGTLAFAAGKTATKINLSQESLATNTVLSAPLPVEGFSKTTVAFNFVGLSKGKTNIYLDIGGMSDKVRPSLSFRSYSNKEKVKKLSNQEATVDRNLATLGASVTLASGKQKSLILSPYLYFGNEKNLLDTVSKNGIGARLVAQFELTKNFGVQLGLDGNNMEGSFVNDVYLGAAFNL